VYSTSDEPALEGEGEIMEIVISKGVTGLGFIIQGGKSTPKGDLPISVKRIFKGSMRIFIFFTLNCMFLCLALKWWQRLIVHV
jgi:hypothetical protein